MCLYKFPSHSRWLPSLLSNLTLRFWTFSVATLTNWYDQLALWSVLNICVYIGYFALLSFLIPSYSLLSTIQILPFYYPLSWKYSRWLCICTYIFCFIHFWSMDTCLPIQSQSVLCPDLFLPAIYMSGAFISCPFFVFFSPQCPVQLTLDFSCFLTIQF